MACWMTQALAVSSALEDAGVQVVKGVGLVSFSFQFLTRLAAVFAEDVTQPPSHGRSSA